MFKFILEKFNYILRLVYILFIIIKFIFFQNEKNRRIEKKESMECDRKFTAIIGFYRFVIVSVLQLFVKFIISRDQQIIEVYNELLQNILFKCIIGIFFKKKYIIIIII